MGLDADKLLFQAMNFVAKKSDEIDKKSTLEGLVDVVYSEKNMIVNGNFIEYPPDTTYSEKDGFTICGEDHQIIFTNSTNFVFASNSRNFTFYCPTDNIEKALASIKSALIVAIKKCMSNTDFTLLSTSDGLDVLIGNADKYKASYGEFFINKTQSLYGLVRLFVCLLSVKYVHKMLNLAINDAKHDTIDFNSVYNAWKECDEELEGLDLWFMSVITRADIKALIEQTVVKHITMICENLQD